MQTSDERADEESVYRVPHNGALSIQSGSVHKITAQEAQVEYSKSSEKERESPVKTTGDKSSGSAEK